MKRNSIVIILCLFSFYAFAQHSSKDLVGTWVKTDSEGKSGSVLFTDTNRVVINFPNGESPKFTFKINLPRNPAKIDMVQDNVPGVLKGYITFLDDNTIRFQIFPDGNRPEVYDAKTAIGPVLTLKRKKG